MAGSSPDQPSNTPTNTAPPPTPNKRPLGVGQVPTAIEAPQPNPLIDYFRKGFSDVPYQDTAAFQQLLNNFSSDPEKFLVNEQNASNWQNLIKGYGDQFALQFKNAIGRDPTPAEYNTFFQQVVLPLDITSHTPESLDVQQRATNLLNTAFSRTAQDEAQKKLEEQSNAAVAPGSAFDVWQQSYRNSLNDVEKSLTDYQTRLFEKIRPQLITSLGAQGLLNTGALNEAFAGAAGDLASANSDYLASAKGAINQDIANQRYSLESAPTSYRIANTVNTPTNLTSSGQQALQNVWQNILTQNYLELQNAYQNQLLDKQYAQNPSVLSQYGGLILGGIAGGLGSAYGKKLAGG